MGIKLEVGKRYRDGYGKPRAIVMRFSASVYMAHDGAKYSDTGKRLVEYEYDSRFDLIALEPDEAPEAQPDELAALRARVAELEQEIVAHDHTIAEIGERAATLRARLTEAEESADLHFCRAERAEAENARLREALKFYGGHDPENSDHGDWVEKMNEDGGDVARTALTAKEPAR